MYRKIFKRIIDIILSSLALLILIPVLILIGILIKCDSKGPIIFKQKRLGLKGKGYNIFKFRTMINRAQDQGPDFTVKNDKRITRLGKVLRSTSIDELPQLFNVILGDMSLIGPRPGIYYENISKFHKDKTKVRPGITGLAQVNGRSNLPIEEKRKLDLRYIEDITLKKDCIIFFKTVLIVLKKNDVN